MTKMKDLTAITYLSFILGTSSTIPQLGIPKKPILTVSFFMRQLF